MWWMSNALVLFVSAAYTRIKQLEMKKTHEQRLEKLLIINDDDRQQLIKDNVWHKLFN